MNVTAPFNCEMDSAALRIRGPLTINSVEQLQAALALYASQNSSLELDLSNVDSCDAAGLQLLYSLRKSAADLGKQLSICAVSEPVTTLATALGLPIDSLALAAARAEETELPPDGASNRGV